MLLNSNADTYFSFTNALGMMSAEQVRGIKIVATQYPRACWVIALHHHLIEYPCAAKALSERIGTALINGNWFVRQLQPFAQRAVVMHGHRHIDWIGQCPGFASSRRPLRSWRSPTSGIRILSIHSLAAGADGYLRLAVPCKIIIDGQSVAFGPVTAEP